MIQRYDVVIVGGSFAGLACARTAALKGLKVAVIDSKPEPGARVRTTGIVVKEASDDFDLPARLMRKVRGVRLYAPNGRSLDLSAPGYFFQATDTAGVLRWMAGEAERAGAALLYGRKFETAIEHARGVALPGLGLHAGFLIGADGARSKVAELFGLSRNTHFVAGLEIECDPLEDLDGRFLHCFADSRIAPGYIAWGGSGSRFDPDRRRGAAAGQARSRRIAAAPQRRVRHPQYPRAPAPQRLDPDRRHALASGHEPGAAGGRRGRHGVADDGRRHPYGAQFRAPRRAARVRLSERPGAPSRRAARARGAGASTRRACCARVLDAAPPNPLINALLMTAPMKALAQRLYFHSRGQGAGSFDDWAEEFERGELAKAAPELPTPKLRLI
ncbi:MAG: FAD-dependent oxidoreductase [Rhizomicrobium sp.]